MKGGPGSDGHGADRITVLTGAVLLGLLAISAGCAPSATVTSGEEIKADLELPPYDGPPIPIAVGPCADRTGGGNVDIETSRGTGQIRLTSEVGEGMADMLVTGLVNSDRFKVLESDDAVLRDMQRERGIQADSMDQRALQAAELLVTCAVTEFEPKAAGGGGGILDVFGDVVAGIGGGGNKSTVAIDLRLVDTDTRQILESFKVEGEATDVALGGLLGGFLGPLAGFGGYRNQPIEKAVRVALLEAVEELARKAPAEFEKIQTEASRESTASPDGGPADADSPEEGTSGGTSDDSGT